MSVLVNAQFKKH